MKIIAFISALFLFGLTISPFFQGHGCCEDTAIHEPQTNEDEKHACCSIDTVDTDESKDKGCCDDGVCLHVCLCHNHALFVMATLKKPIESIRLPKIPKKKASFLVRPFISKAYITEMWRPPNA